MLESTAVNSAGEQIVQISAGAEKQGCTVMLATTSDTQKLPPYVLFKWKTMAEMFPAGSYTMGLGMWLDNGRSSRKLG
jgi:hypothetical protein